MLSDLLQPNASSLVQKVIDFFSSFFFLIGLWLCLVVAVSRGYSPVVMPGFLLLWSMDSRGSGLGSYGSWA